MPGTPGVHGNMLLSVLLILSVGAANAISELANRCVNPGQVALTFEGGPSPALTPLVLDALKRFNATATFYIRTAALDSWPAIAIAKRAISEGHVIGYLLDPATEMDANIDSESLGNTLSYSLDKVERVIGRRPKFIRASFANTTAKFGSFLNSNGQIFTNPSIDTLDSDGATALKSIINMVMRGSSDIIRAHDTNPTTANCAKDIVEHLVVTLGLNLVDIVNCTGMSYAYDDEKEKGELGKGVADRPLDVTGGLFGNNKPKEPEKNEDLPPKIIPQVANGGASRAHYSVIVPVAMALICLSLL